MEERNNRLLNAKVDKYIIPGIMMSLALQLGNIVDTIFVSNLIGVEAMSAVTLSLPVETLVQLTGYCLGIGGSIAVGNMLGKRDKEGASKLFSATFMVTLVVGIIFSICALPVAEPVARLLVSGNGVLTGYTRDYIRVSMLGAPVIGIGLMMVNYLGVENHPELASAYLITANVINLVLDYIFLRYTPLGITGASLSTVLGFLFAMGIFVLYIRSDKRNLHLILLKPGELGITKEAIITGVPMLIFMAANFVKALGLNTIIMNQLGEEGMAVFTVCDNVLLIVEMLTGGIIGVIPNVAGILFGEKDYVGIRVLCKKMLKYSYILLAVIFVLIMLFTEEITVLFGSGGVMTALVIAESGVPMNKSVKITKEDYLRSSASSKLRNGMVMPRSELLKAALMSSDNRAAHALARTTPQGKAWFIKQMNLTAKRLGMEDTFFADPTGLDNRNHSTARDLAKLVAAAYEYKDIREASTMSAAQLRAGRYVLNLHTTNRLIGNPDWNIGIQKTGFTTAAGRCMVVQSEVGSRRVVMVVLDSPNNTQRAADMTSMKQFVEAENRIDRQFSTALPYEIF